MLLIYPNVSSKDLQEQKRAWFCITLMSLLRPDINKQCKLNLHVSDYIEYQSMDWKCHVHDPKVMGLNPSRLEFKVCSPSKFN